MDSNLTVYHMALHATRTRLPAQAERGWLAAQAAAVRPPRSRTASTRRWMGAALILAGERMQGAASPVFTSVRPNRRAAPTQHA